MSWGLSVVRTDRGRRLRLGRAVEASAGDAWSLLAEVRHWATWGPAVTDVKYSEAAVTAGEDGLVQLLGLLWLRFRVETVTDRAWTWTIGGWTPPADGHAVDDRGEGACDVAFELPLWAPWYLPVCALALRTLARVAEQRAAGARQ